MPDALEQIGEGSIERWGYGVLIEWSKTIIPVHDYCRCRVTGGRWIHEPDACPTCKAMARDWNDMVHQPPGEGEVME